MEKMSLVLSNCFFSPNVSIVQYLMIICIKMQYFPVAHNHFLVLRNLATAVVINNPID